MTHKVTNTSRKHRKKKQLAHSSNDKAYKTRIAQQKGNKPQWEKTVQSAKQFASWLQRHPISGLILLLVVAACTFVYKYFALVEKVTTCQQTTIEKMLENQQGRRK